MAMAIACVYGDRDMALITDTNKQSVDVFLI